MSVATVAANAASRIADAISRAARATGASFEYLLATAQIESNLNPKAQAPTSSAQGLYQFIDQTWLATVKRAGPALGLGTYADAIVPTAGGHYDVPDPTARAAIMKLRSDPTVSAMMAGAFTRSNAAELAGAIGRQPTEGELYIAHFLGPDGAGKLINAAIGDPNGSAAALFPQAAAANRSIFYDASGRARSAREVYGTLTGRFAAARTAALNAGLIAGNAAQPIPNTAAVTQALAQAAQPPPRQLARPLFLSMFTDPVRGAVNRTVSALWTPASAAAPVAGQPAQPLNLFTDRGSNPRSLFGGS
jgi:Transglycosylase SLT domain